MKINVIIIINRIFPVVLTRLKIFCNNELNEFCMLLIISALSGTRFNKKSGKLHGNQEGWHENGQLDYQEEYVNGVLSGIKKQWHENGQLKFDCKKLNGKLNGLLKEWYKNGQLKSETTYILGKPEGIQKAWYENGQQKYVFFNKDI